MKFDSTINGGQSRQMIRVVQREREKKKKLSNERSGSRVNEIKFKKYAT